MKLENYLIKRQFFSERVNNKFVLRRNFSIQKKSKVLIIEDVITTGKSSVECAEIIKKSQADIIGFACIIDRSNKNSLLEKKSYHKLKLIYQLFPKKIYLNIYQK